MGQKRKILILTASYGHGHITAAKSISEAISKNFPEHETKIIDLLQFWNPQQRFLFFFQKFKRFFVL
jgi:UDP-N-acetylglucosamine:LPS N-acetylglucosamine transferase